MNDVWDIFKNSLLTFRIFNICYLLKSPPPGFRILEILDLFEILSRLGAAEGCECTLRRWGLETRPHVFTLRALDIRKCTRGPS